MARSSGHGLYSEPQLGRASNPAKGACFYGGTGLRILVTGSTGFIGRRVVRALAAGGHSVRAAARSSSRGAMFDDLDVEVVQADVLEAGSLERACEGVDAVVHMVAVVRETGALTFHRVNYDGTVNLLRAAEAAGARRFVHASTIGASSDPAVPYLYSRWMAEQEIERSPMTGKILRFSVGFGKGDEFFNVLAALVKASPVVPIAGDGTARFQPIAAEDAARCLGAAVDDDEEGDRVLELGGPAHHTYDEMIDIIAETVGVRTAKLHVPLDVFAPMVSVMEALMPRPPVTSEQMKMLGIDNTTALDSVEKSFGFAPRPMRGNIDYVKTMSYMDALKINLGLMPAHIRDH